MVNIVDHVLKTKKFFLKYTYNLYFHLNDNLIVLIYIRI